MESISVYEDYEDEVLEEIESGITFRINSDSYIVFKDGEVEDFMIGDTRDLDSGFLENLRREHR